MEQLLERLEGSIPSFLQIVREKDLDSISPEMIKQKFNLTESQFPKNCLKFFHQREKLFSWYHDGEPPWLDRESWYSVTPEKIARNTARHARNCLLRAGKLPASKGRPAVLVDMFCGAGGNAIQFAHRFPLVIAIDLCLDRLFCCLNNLRRRNLQHKVLCIRGNCVDAIPWLQKEFNVLGVYLSPPWGGVEAVMSKSYSITSQIKLCSDSFGRINGVQLLEHVYNGLSKNVVYFIPRNSDILEFRRCRIGEPSESIVFTVQRDLIGDKTKSLTVYTGLFAY